VPLSCRQRYFNFSGAFRAGVQAAWERACKRKPPKLAVKLYDADDPAVNPVRSTAGYTGQRKGYSQRHFPGATQDVRQPGQKAQERPSQETNDLNAGRYLEASKMTSERFRDLFEAEYVAATRSATGIIANRTWRSELTHDEGNRLSALADISRDTYGTMVPLFETFIRNSPEVRAAEDDHRPLKPDDATYKLFTALAEEVIGNLPAFCRPVPAEHRAKEVVS